MAYTVGTPQAILDYIESVGLDPAEVTSITFNFTANSVTLAMRRSVTSAATGLTTIVIGSTLTDDRPPPDPGLPEKKGYPPPPPPPERPPLRPDTPHHQE
jgi:hypothetical protein